MRKRIQYRPYVFFVATLFFILCIPQSASQRMRHFAVSSVAPPWQALNFLKHSCLNLLMITPPGGKAGSAEAALELETLKLENHTLRSQLKNVREWLLQEERINEQLQRWKILDTGREDPSNLQAFYKRRAFQLKTALELQLQALSAKVIYREPASWSSFLWVNVGEQTNRILKKRIVAKNSPVVIGTSLVGVVEEVREKQSKVRLITDSGLVPSVRAFRGVEQNRFLSEYLEGLLLGLETRKDLLQTPDEKESILLQLGKIRERLKNPSEDFFLAKGELYGSSQALWRAREPLLKGVGFNYDYADREGVARDLRTGETPDGKHKALPLLKVGDLLVTTGMDGIFPSGLRVAVISQVIPLREGSCSYEIEAKAVCGNLDDLTFVTVLPPLDFEKTN